MESKYPQWTLDDLETEIDTFCGGRLTQKRHELFQSIRQLHHDVDISKVILLAIRHAQETGRDNTNRAKDNAWYWSERDKLENQIQELAEHPFIRGGIHPEQIQFYEPDKVDCIHRRRRKTCEKLGAKVFQWTHWKQWMKSLHIQQDESWEYFLKPWKQNMQRIFKEIQSLDPSIHATNVASKEFCPPLLNDETALVPTPPPHKQPGAPKKWQHDFFLMSVGNLLKEATSNYIEPLGYYKIAEIIACIIVRCFPHGRKSDQELLKQEKPMAPALAKRWQTLRNPPLPTDR